MYGKLLYYKREFDDFVERQIFAKGCFANMSWITKSPVNFRPSYIFHISPVSNGNSLEPCEIFGPEYFYSSRYHSHEKLINNYTNLNKQFPRTKKKRDTKTLSFFFETTRSFQDFEQKASENSAMDISGRYESNFFFFAPMYSILFTSLLFVFSSHVYFPSFQDFSRDTITLRN